MKNKMKFFIIDPKSRTINDLEKKLMDSFEAETGRLGEFRTAKCKDIIDKIDMLISRYYGLTNNELKFVINYDSHIRPNQSKTSGRQ